MREPTGFGVCYYTLLSTDGLPLKLNDFDLPCIVLRMRSRAFSGLVAVISPARKVDPGLVSNRESVSFMKPSVMVLCGQCLDKS